MSDRDAESIRNWHRLDARVTTSGQPTEAQLAALQALGVRHVINLALHSHEEALADEGASLAALGIGYTHIPVVWQNPTEADFAEFCAVYDARREVPIHVHCIMNYRVSAFFYRYRRQVLGMSALAARPDLEKLWRPTREWADFIGLMG